ncbi:MAG: glutamine synthetase, partial [Candidatus Altiarchaeota archaeon]
KLIVKEIARQKGVHASFMPKPVFGINGSGMHTHQSLFKGKSNAFFDKKDQVYLSSIARGYIAGLLKHAREMAAITNQSVNSYKRLVPGYEAPVYVAWSLANRSALVRVPNFKPGAEKATRVELRNPDPGGNPYLQFAVMIAAGLEGIEKGYKLPAPVNKNIYELSEAERSDLDIPTLPGSLGEAVELFKASELMKKTLGKHMFERFVEIKTREWDEYRTYVSKWELDRYLPIM